MQVNDEQMERIPREEVRFDVGITVHVHREEGTKAKEETESKKFFQRCAASRVNNYVTFL